MGSTRARSGEIAAWSSFDGVHPGPPNFPRSHEAELRECFQTFLDRCAQGSLFGSIARGEATVDSDIDLAVIAAGDWQGKVNLEDTVRTRLGNDCDVLAFTSAEFTKLAHDGEPVVIDILRHGIALVGDKPHVRKGAA